MGKGMGIIIGIIAIIVVTAIIQQGGWNNYKGNPLQSSVDATKSIADKSKETFDKGKEIYSKNWGDGTSGGSSGSSLKNLGLPLCGTDASCNTINECGGDLCKCLSGECFINQTN